MPHRPLFVATLSLLLSPTVFAAPGVYELSVGATSVGWLVDTSDAENLPAGWVADRLYLRLTSAVETFDVTWLPSAPLPDPGAPGIVVFDAAAFAEPVPTCSTSTWCWASAGGEGLTVSYTPASTGGDRPLVPEAWETTPLPESCTGGFGEGFGLGVLLEQGSTGEAVVFSGCGRVPVNE